MIYDNIITNEAIWVELKTMIQHQKLPHALLFHGPDGSGKEAHAIELAALLNNCDETNQLAKIKKFQHPNINLIIPMPREKTITKKSTALDCLSEKSLEHLIEMKIKKMSEPYATIKFEKASSILINSIRDLHKNSHFSVDNGNVVNIIFEAEKLCSPKTEPGNALLKILEEPPKNTFFILIASNKDKLLDTILSRCCDFYFSKDAGPPKESESMGSPPIDWLDRQLEAHADGSDGGVGTQPMGELQIEGIYPLAYIYSLCSSPFERVVASTATHFHQANVDNQVDDLAALSFVLENGVIGSLAIGRIGAASHPDIGEIKLHLIGTKGALVVSEARPEVGLYYKDQPKNEFKNIRIDNDNDFLLMDAFADALDCGTELPLDIETACNIARIIDAAQISANEGREVKIS